MCERTDEDVARDQKIIDGIGDELEKLQTKNKALKEEKKDIIHQGLVWHKKYIAFKDSRDELITVILQCEQDRLSAQMSGLETGWEHPGTQTHFKKVLACAKTLKEKEA